MTNAPMLGMLLLVLTSLNLCDSSSPEKLPTRHIVGGITGWDFRSNLEDWADSRVFYTEDILVFKTSSGHSVLEVGQYGFLRCSTANQIGRVQEGETITITLTEAGPKFFICPRAGHCSMGLKLRLNVRPRNSQNQLAADKDNNKVGQTQLSEKKKKNHQNKRKIKGKVGD